MLGSAQAQPGSQPGSALISPHTPAPVTATPISPGIYNAQTAWNAHKHQDAWNARNDENCLVGHNFLKANQEFIML